MPLKRKPQSKLNLARVSRGIRKNTELWSPERAAGRSEDWTVEEIEELRPELYLP